MTKNSIYDSLGVRGFIIKYNNVEEALEIANILSEYDYEVYEYDYIYKDAPHWDCFIPFNYDDDDLDYDFCLARYSYFKDKYKDKIIDYDEFLNRIGHKKRKKLEKPELDPFGEEHWGYIQESLTIDDFQVGDRVKINELGVKNMHNNFLGITADEYSKIRSNGIVIEILFYDNRLYIEWENEDSSSYPVKYVEKIDYKKRRNPNIDPFNEENWGYVQEKKEDIYILVTPKFYEYCDRYKWSMRSFVGKVFKVEGESNFKNMDVYMLDKYDKNNWNQTVEFSHYGSYAIPCDCAEIVNPNSIKKIKKLEKPEIDPFGEENWGYVQESLNYYDLKVGDRVKADDSSVLPSTKLSGEGTVVRLDDRRKLFFVIWDGYYERTLHRCSRISFLNKIKKRNLNVDPFDEENWGYID